MADRKEVKIIIANMAELFAEQVKQRAERLMKSGAIDIEEEAHDMEVARLLSVAALKDLTEEQVQDIVRVGRGEDLVNLGSF